MRSEVRWFRRARVDVALSSLEQQHFIYAKRKKFGKREPPTEYRITQTGHSLMFRVTNGNVRLTARSPLKSEKKQQRESSAHAQQEESAR